MPFTILYARTSTETQTVEHQRTAAEATGYVLDAVAADEGVSGVSTCLADRPQGRRLLDMLREGDLIVVRNIDRFGRRYDDVRDTLHDLMRRGVGVRTVTAGHVFDASLTDPA